MIVKSPFDLHLKLYPENIPNEPREVKITVFQPDECPDSALIPSIMCGGQIDASRKGSCAVSKIR